MCDSVMADYFGNPGSPLLHLNHRYLYAIGNSRARDLSEECKIPDSPEFLVLGGGDIRHVLFTVSQISQLEKSPSSILMYVNDADDVILARNILLLKVFKYWAEHLNINSKKIKKDRDSFIQKYVSSEYHENTTYHTAIECLSAAEASIFCIMPGSTLFKKRQAELKSYVVSGVSSSAQTDTLNRVNATFLCPHLKEWHVEPSGTPFHAYNHGIFIPSFTLRENCMEQLTQWVAGWKQFLDNGGKLQRWFVDRAVSKVDRIFLHKLLRLFTRQLEGLPRVLSYDVWTLSSRRFYIRNMVGSLELLNVFKLIVDTAFDCKLSPVMNLCGSGLILPLTVIYLIRTMQHKVKRGVLNMWREEMKNLEESEWTCRYTMDISEKSRDAFTQLLEDEEWYRKNLPKPDRLYKVTMSTRIIRNSVFLKTIYRAEPVQRKLMIDFAEMDQLYALCDIVMIILHGQLILTDIHREKLKHYRNVIRALASNRIDIARKKRTLLAYHENTMVKKVDKQKVDSILKKIYYNTSTEGAFLGPEKLYRVLKTRGIHNIGKNTITKWLQNQDHYSLQKPARKSFKKARVVVSGIDDMFDANLGDFTRLSDQNDKVKHVLFVIDVFTKYLWVEPLKNKTAKEVVGGFKKIFNKGRICKKLRTDSGAEFISKITKNYVKSLGIYHFNALNSLTKANIAERVIQTIKNMLQRWITKHGTHRYIDVLQDIVKSYNATPIEVLNCP
ncbi:unnamed protein product [Mytilus coruscus]|uniref:Integrase catalytic domain-containing protein n=1 Tax=Mytilus coruscus TaxID=42192 RepID=A0A6J8A9I7_MYTCO|nr:unnamed protein product [Mytilus coruscus]